MAEPAFILEGTGENFGDLVLENSRRGLVLVDFWSPRAGPSLRQRELLSCLAQEYAGRFLLVSVNTDRERRLADAYGVRSLPSFKLFRHARVVEEVRGMQPEADYRRIVDRHLGSRPAGIKAQALAAWEQGDPDQALRILAEGALEQPEVPALPATMAKMLMRLERNGDADALLEALPEALRGDPEIRRLRGHLGLIVAAEGRSQPDALRALIDASPDDCASRYQLAARCVLADDYDGGLEQLMEVLRRDVDFGRGRARDAMLALLEMLEGERPELVKRYRAEVFRLAH